MSRLDPICRTCGVQYPAGDALPEVCKICADERQYIGPNGQEWTNLDEMKAEGYRGKLDHETPEIIGVGTEAHFAIGQRALLVPGSKGNLMWDATPYIDDDIVEQVESHGGLSAIALSHPHYYSSMVEWSKAFGNVPIYVHERDAQWLTRNENVELWSGAYLEVLPGRTIINARSHFAGGSVLHWKDGASGRGALCASDIFTVAEDRRWVSFMYSYPNFIPEHPDTIARALVLTNRFDYDALYGAWWGKVVRRDAKQAVWRSACRYFEHIGLSVTNLQERMDEFTTQDLVDASST